MIFYSKKGTGVYNEMIDEQYSISIVQFNSLSHGCDLPGP